jgi:hypothetical protein
VCLHASGVLHSSKIGHRIEFLQRVTSDRRDAPTRAVGLPPAAERLDLFEQSGSSSFDSFRAYSAPTTEESGHFRTLALQKQVAPLIDGAGWLAPFGRARSPAGGPCYASWTNGGAGCG